MSQSPTGFEIRSNSSKSVLTTLLIGIISVFLVSVVTSADSDEKSDEGPLGLERKLYGVWKGPACGGDWTYRADGTFAVHHYTPGNNKLSGTWDLRWDALPPTLVRNIKTSDAPDRIKVGETWEVKLTELNDETFAYEWPKNPGQAVHFMRMKE